MKHLLNLSLFLLLICVSISEAGEFPASKHLRKKLDEYNYEVNLVEHEEDNSHSSINVDARNYTPVVFWHGMGDTAYGSINVVRLALQRKYPGMRVFSVQIGNNPIEDEMSGYVVNVNHQIDQVCKKILSNNYIKSFGSFNAVGFSQGCQFLRGLIQRCPLRHNGIDVKNFISLGGQHQGVFGLPNCETRMGFNLICNQIRELLTTAAYEKNVQNTCVQAEYWHDPYREAEYRAKNIFLADINNENSFNQTYYSNMINLRNFVLVGFLEDMMVIPRESSLFGFYKPNQTDEIVTMEKTALYLEDRIGLKRLDEAGRLKQIRVRGDHLQFKMKWFLGNIAAVYLEN